MIVYPAVEFCDNPLLQKKIILRISPEASDALQPKSHLSHHREYKGNRGVLLNSMG